MFPSHPTPPEGRQPLIDPGALRSLRWASVLLYVSLVLGIALWFGAVAAFLTVLVSFCTLMFLVTVEAEEELTSL